MQGNVLEQTGGGGDKINGIIEEYVVASGGNVNAGEFVKFINTNVLEKIENDHVNYSTKPCYAMSAVKLSDTKVFVACSYYASAFDKYHLSAIIFTIKNNIISRTNQSTLLSNTSIDMATYISAATLSENKVFIAHTGQANPGRLNGIIVTVDGTDITQGTDTAIVGGAYTGVNFSVVALSENKVFIAHSYGSNYNLYGVVCTINGTSITSNTDTKILAKSDYYNREGKYIQACLVDDNKIFIAHNSRDTNSTNTADRHYLYGIIIDIEENTITVGTDTAISAGMGDDYTASECVSIVNTEKNKVFIAFARDSSYHYLYGVVCKISGTTITVGSVLQISTEKFTARVNSAVVLRNKNQVFIAHSYGDNYNLYGVVCTINGTSITKDTDTLLDDAKYSMYFGESNHYGGSESIILDNNKVLIIHPANYDSTIYSMYATLAQTPFDCVSQLESSSDEISGIAKTKGTDGQTVKIIVPEEVA